MFIESIESLNSLTDIQAGVAGEYLVCADLILSGFSAFHANQGLHFDCVVEIGSRLIKIQVKTTRTVRKGIGGSAVGGYKFNLSRRGFKGSQKYHPGMVDIFALVALDSRDIGYIASKDINQKLFIFRSPLLKGKYQDEILAPRTKNIEDLRSQGFSFGKIADMTGLDKAFIHRVVNGKSGQMRNPNYLSDFTFKNAAVSAGFMT